MKNVLTNLLVESSLKFAGYGGQIQIYFKSMSNHYKNVCCCMLSKNVTDFIVEHRKCRILRIENIVKFFFCCYRQTVKSEWAPMCSVSVFWE